MHADFKVVHFVTIYLSDSTVNAMLLIGPKSNTSTNDLINIYN